MEGGAAVSRPVLSLHCTHDDLDKYGRPVQLGRLVDYRTEPYNPDIVNSKTGIPEAAQVEIMDRSTGQWETVDLERLERGPVSSLLDTPTRRGEVISWEPAMSSTPTGYWLNQMEIEPRRRRRRGDLWRISCPQCPRSAEVSDAKLSAVFDVLTRPATVQRDTDGDAWATLALFEQVIGKVT